MTIALKKIVSKSGLDRCTVQGQSEKLWWSQVEQELQECSVTDREGVRQLGTLMNDLLNEKPELLESHKPQGEERAGALSYYSRLKSNHASFNPKDVMERLCLFNGVSGGVLLEKFNQLSPLMATNDDRRECLSCASHLGLAALVGRLLDKGCYLDEDGDRIEGLPANMSEYEDSPLYNAVLTGQVAVVTVLLDHTGDLKSTDITSDHEQDSPNQAVYEFLEHTMEFSHEPALADAFYYNESREIADLLINKYEEIGRIPSVVGMNASMTLVGYYVDRLITNEERLRRETPTEDLQLLKKIVSWAPSVFLDCYGEGDYERESPLAHIFEKGSDALKQFCLDEIVLDKELDWVNEYDSLYATPLEDWDYYYGPPMMTRPQILTEDADVLPRVSILEKILFRREKQELEYLLPYIALQAPVLGNMTALAIAAKMKWVDGVELIVQAFERRVSDSFVDDVNRSDLQEELTQLQSNIGSYEISGSFESVESDDIDNLGKLLKRLELSCGVAP